MIICFYNIQKSIVSSKLNYVEQPTIYRKILSEMKYLLYYNLDSKFVSDQTAAGGDGTSVVSVVDGVAWTKDQEKTYYRYSSNSGDVVTYTITIKYSFDDTVRGITASAISTDDTCTVNAYRGMKTTVKLLPKKIDGYAPLESVKYLTVSGNTTYTFKYNEDIPENVSIRCYYKKTTTSTKLYHYYGNPPAGSTNDYNKFDYAISYLIIDGNRVEKSELTKKNSWEGRFYSFTGNNNTTHIVDYVIDDNFKKYPDDILATYRGSAFSGVSAMTDIKVLNLVRTIGSSAFTGCSSLKTTFIGDSVRHLGNGCFMGCSGLSNVVLSENLTNLGNYCFGNCTSLSSITLHNGIEALGNYCFYNCKLLKTITLPDTINSIGDHCFYATKLSKVTIPSGITHLSGYCFFSCTTLYEVSLPSDLISIGDSCFAKCTALSAITIPDSVITLYTAAFSDCTRLYYMFLPDSVKTISERCFWGCTGLTNVTFGSGLTSIGSNCFYRCSGLTTIYAYTPAPPTINNDTFKEVRSGGTLFYETGSDYSSWLSNSSYYLGYYSWVQKTPYNNGHRFVDLYLNSQNINYFIADRNLGAANPEDIGDKYAWGEIEPKSAYTWDNYKYASGFQAVTKYNDTDGLIELEDEDDAVKMNMGGDWITGDFIIGALLNSSYMTRKAQEINGKRVIVFTSKFNGHKVILPATSTSGANASSGVYMASNQRRTNHAYATYGSSFGTDGASTGTYNRCQPCLVRGVLAKN